MGKSVSLEAIKAAQKIVYQHMSRTPAINWPLLSQRVGADVWVKHENHTPIGAFKVRGGIVFMSELQKTHPNCPGVITATRGNHGQSVARAASALGLSSIIYVPKGNNPEKNEAMKAMGADLVQYGEDYQESYEECMRRAEGENRIAVPPFHPALVAGVATYSLEFFEDVTDLRTVYVPIGMGSGICGMISVRDALGLKTEIVGVVAENAPAYSLSMKAGRLVETNTAATFADGVACRAPNIDAFEVIANGAARIVEVSEEEISEAMRAYFKDTHNLSEGAGAAPLAALMKEQDIMVGRKVGIILSGGNVDGEQFMTVMGGETPKV